MKELLLCLRYDLPLWVMGLLTNWWPDIGPALRIRGALFRPFIGKCGRGFAIGRDVTLRVPSRLTIGDNVYLAKGTWIDATGYVTIEDEVLISPYVVLSSSKHGFKEGSPHAGGVHLAPVRIGRGSWLSSHVVVAAGVAVGKGNVVGANGVVTKDTDDDVFVGGVPARVIAPRIDSPSEITGR